MLKSFIFVLAGISNLDSQPKGDLPAAEAWDRRQEVISQLSKNVDKVLRTNSRAVRRGTENPRVNNLLKSQVDQANHRLRTRKLAINVYGDQDKKSQFQLTTPELEQVLNRLNPYQRDFAESAFQTKKLLGRLLHVSILPFDGNLPESHRAFAVDLEKATETPPEVKSFLEKFGKSKGNSYIAIFTNRIPLPDPSFSLKSEVLVEQKTNGDITVYHQRLRNRDSNKMFAQVYTELPAVTVFVRKSELIQDLKPDSKISHLIIDTYDTNGQN